jgi:hypothetical protein
MSKDNKTLDKQQNGNDFIADVISRYSGENLMKLQERLVKLYGSDEMAKEKANSCAVGFGKACELICKDLLNGL